MKPTENLDEIMRAGFAEAHSNTFNKAENEIARFERHCSAKNEHAIISDFKNEMLLLIDAFGKSGDLSASAPYIARAITESLFQLMMQKPLFGITGDPEEWIEYAPGHFQNKILSSVFKERTHNYRAHYLDAIVFVSNEDEFKFTGVIHANDGTLVRSSNFIKQFPFEEKTFYVPVTALHNAEDENDIAYECDINDPVLIEAFTFYDRMVI